MLRRFSLAMVGALALMTASPALFAQGGNGPNVFMMFFAPIPANATILDWIGVIQIWLLLLGSIVTIALIIQFAMKARKIVICPDEVKDTVAQMLDEKKFREAIDYTANDKTLLGLLLAAALRSAGSGYDAMIQAINETADPEIVKMLRPLEYLSVIGNVGPMLGLFGTVYGIIVAFAGLVSAGGKPDPAALAGGISTALVTTFWGLIIAMPAVTAYAVLRNKIDEFTTDAIKAAEEVIAPLKPGATARTKA